MAYNHGLPNSHLIEGGGEACGRKMEMGRRRTCGITLNEHKNTHLIFRCGGEKGGGNSEA